MGSVNAQQLLRTIGSRLIDNVHGAADMLQIRELAPKSEAD
jgi:hypothetical protein